MIISEDLFFSIRRIKVLLESMLILIVCRIVCIMHNRLALFSSLIKAWSIVLLALGYVNDTSLAVRVKYVLLARSLKSLVLLLTLHHLQLLSFLLCTLSS